MTDLQFTTNQSESTQARFAYKDSKAWLVIPGIAARTMVMNDELLDGGELQSTLTDWDGVPVTLNHPQVRGEMVSAKQVGDHLGFFGDVVLDGDKLRGNYWLDVARMVQPDAMAIFHKFSQALPVETSTGYFRTLEPGPGMHEGRSYTGIQRNIIPDHVAILPDALGACSVADGCGAMRTNTSTSSATVCSCGCGKTTTEIVAVNIEEIETMAEEAKEVKKEVQAVGLRQAQPQMDGEQGRTVVGEQGRTVDYRPDMEQKFLAVNAQLEETKAKLASFETFFTRFGGVDQVANMLTVAQQQAQAMAANVAREKDTLVAALVANSKCMFPVEVLDAMSIEQLGFLAASLAPADYSGRGLASNRNQGMDEELVDFPMPVFVEGK